MRSETCLAHSLVANSFDGTDYHVICVLIKVAEYHS